MKNLLIATKNRGKIEEFRRIIEEFGGQIDLKSTLDFPHLVDVEETGSTFVENALIKARAYVKQSGLPSLSDDSGICVDALNAMPGIYSARWAGSHGDDQANLKLLLDQLSHVPSERRTGSFRCAVALVFPDGREFVEEGEMRGRIIESPRGSGGFGYDPIFVADGFQLTTSEISAAEKDRISHRGKALRAITPLLLVELDR